jgi:hypothetical protein
LTGDSKAWALGAEKSAKLIITIRNAALKFRKAAIGFLLRIEFILMIICFTVIWIKKLPLKKKTFNHKLLFIFKNMKDIIHFSKIVVKGQLWMKSQAAQKSLIQRLF